MTLILSSRGQASYEQRYSAIKSLGLRDISPQNYNTIVELLSENTGYSEENAVYEYALRNELLIVLIDHAPDQDALGREMLKWVNKDGQAALWREYVIQHFFEYYQRRWGANLVPGQRRFEEANRSETLREEIQRMLASCLFDHADGVCGSALMISRRLGEHFPEFPLDVIDQRAIEIARDQQRELATRTSALQCLATSSDARSVQVALDILTEKDSELTLSLAALNILSNHPEVQIPNVVMDQLTNHPSKRIAQMAEDMRSRQEVQSYRN